MGREVRRVPANWEHPRHTEETATYPSLVGKYRALYEGYAEAAAEFMDMATTKGLQEAVDYFGRAPDKNDYMPDWPEAERTHFMMYETTSEGTPISPAFATPEELARWLADTGASSFGSMTASYEAWLRVARGGFAPSAIMENGTMRSGVEALSDAP